MQKTQIELRYNSDEEVLAFIEWLEEKFEESQDEGDIFGVVDYQKDQYGGPDINTLVIELKN